MTQWKDLFETEIKGSVVEDLELRNFLGSYLLNPTSITARLLHEVPAPAIPLPTTGPDIDRIGPGDPCHRWRTSDPAPE